MLYNTGVIAMPGEIKRRALEGFRCAPLNILKPRTANLQTRTGNLPCCTGNLLRSCLPSLHESPRPPQAG